MFVCITAKRNKRNEDISYDIKKTAAISSLKMVEINLGWNSCFAFVRRARQMASHFSSQMVKTYINLIVFN